MKVKTHFAWLTGFCAVLATTLALPASAAVPGLYFNADVGANWAQDADVKREGPFGANITDDLETDVGFRFSAGVGYNLNHNWGVEFDTGYVWNGIKDSGDSSFSHIPFIVNVVYRYPIGAKLETYIGGGVGGVYSVFTADDGPLDDDDADVVFGWQAIAGIRYLLSETMSVGVGYKYMGTDEGEYDINGLGKFKIDSVHNHSFSAVFNWKF